MNRFFQILLILSVLGLSWLGMMAVHELGHVLHLIFTGGTVDYVLLNPLAISYTHPGENPHPLVVAWGGMVWGCAIPLIVLAIARVMRQSLAYLVAFFAGFCLVTNGAYLAADAFMQGGDGRELVAYGSPPWLMVMLGIVAAASGLWLWNGLGPHFGLGLARGKVDRRVAIAAVLTLFAVIVAEFTLSPLSVAGRLP